MNTRSIFFTIQLIATGAAVVLPACSQAMQQQKQPVCSRCNKLKVDSFAVLYLGRDRVCTCPALPATLPSVPATPASTTQPAPKAATIPAVSFESFQASKNSEELKQQVNTLHKNTVEHLALFKNSLQEHIHSNEASDAECAQKHAQHTADIENLKKQHEETTLTLATLSENTGKHNEAAHQSNAALTKDIQALKVETKALHVARWIDTAAWLTGAAATYIAHSMDYSRNTYLAVGLGTAATLYALGNYGLMRWKKNALTKI